MRRSSEMHCWLRPGLLLTILLWYCVSPAYANSAADALVEDDSPLTEALSLPSWFKLSFLDIKEDIREANRNRRGLILYFGQEHCPYCKALLENNWQQSDIVTYTRAHFDVVAIDVRGQRQVMALDGKEYSEKAFSIKLKTNFTPTLLFFDKEGNLALRLAGYRPPYQFRAALEYVADAHHRREAFHKYMARAETAFNFGNDELNPHPVFSRAPANLKHLLNRSGRALMVSFERPRCHACDVLHGGPLHDPRVLDLLRRLEVTQIDMRSEVDVVTPNGDRVQASQWADQLELSYAPTLLFYDNNGKEIIRVDSVIGFYRLAGVLEYVVSGAYRKFPTYQQWRQGSH